MTTTSQLRKITRGGALAAMAVSAMLLVGTATDANAWHRNRAHVVKGAVGGAVGGALLGGLIGGRKGIGAGAAIGAVVGGAAAASTRPAPPPPPRAYYPPAPVVYNNGLVCEIQASLTRLNYNPGPVDCIFGGLTSNAISRFEFDNRYAVTGQPSQALLYQLRQAGG